MSKTQPSFRHCSILLYITINQLYCNECLTGHSDTVILSIAVDLRCRLMSDLRERACARMYE